MVTVFIAVFYSCPFYVYFFFYLSIHYQLREETLLPYASSALVVFSSLSKHIHKGLIKKIKEIYNYRKWIFWECGEIRDNFLNG